MHSNNTTTYREYNESILNLRIKFKQIFPEQKFSALDSDNQILKTKSISRKTLTAVKTIPRPTLPNLIALPSLKIETNIEMNLSLSDYIKRMNNQLELPRQLYTIKHTINLLPACL